MDIDDPRQGGGGAGGQQGPPSWQQQHSLAVDAGISQLMALMGSQLAADYRDRLHLYLHRKPRGKKTVSQHAAFLNLVRFATKVHADVTAHDDPGGRVMWDKAMEYIRKLGTGHRTGFGTFSVTEFRRKLRELHKATIARHAAAGANTKAPATTTALSVDNVIPCSAPSDAAAAAEHPPHAPHSVTVHVQCLLPVQEVLGGEEVAGGADLGGGVEGQGSSADNAHSHGVPSPQAADVGATQPSPSPAIATSAGSAPQSASQLLDAPVTDPISEPHPTVTESIVSDGPAAGQALPA